MRIGHFAPKLGAPGGIASYISRTGGAQEARGHEVFYFTEEPEKEGGPIHVDDHRALFVEAQQHNLDILHIHKSLTYLPPANERVPVIRTMHGNQGSCPAGTRFLAASKEPCSHPYSVSGCAWRHITERCGSMRPAKLKRHFGRIRRELAQGDVIRTLPVSNFLKEWMIKTGYPSTKLEVIPSPAPERGEQPPPDKEGVPRFLFLGRLVPQKGAEWLLEAFRYVEGKVMLDIAGDGPLEASLQAYVEKNEMSDRVVFHGWQDQENVARLIRQARAVVVPSVWQEPAGLVTLEAAAHARAVIASTAGGIPEYAHPNFALRIAPGARHGLTLAIEQLAHDYELAKGMGERGWALAHSDFSLDRFIDRLDEQYAKVTGQTASVASSSPLS